MFRQWSLFAPCVAVLAFGCDRPPEPVHVPGLQPGDTVRLEISISPKLLHTGDRVAVGVLLRGERPNGETYYINDEEVAIERTVMSTRIAFLNVERLVSEPLDVPLVHDC